MCRWKTWDCKIHCADVDNENLKFTVRCKQWEFKVDCTIFTQLESKVHCADVENEILMFTV